MDFSFSPEQDDLRREARAFLEGNPAPTMEQLAELGWVGILGSDDFTFLDAAVLFEELGRALYEGPFVSDEITFVRTRSISTVPSTARPRLDAK